MHIEIEVITHSEQFEINNPKNNKNNNVNITPSPNHKHT